MTTLMIKDLSLTEELDRTAMAAVHGGRLDSYRLSPSRSYSLSDFFSHNDNSSKTETSITNNVTQIAEVGNNVALVNEFHPYIAMNQTVKNA
jgi:hypothetical protein